MKKMSNQSNLPAGRVQSIVTAISVEWKRRFQSRASLIWFGSWIKGTAYQQSDIDLAIEHHGPIDQKELMAFRNWLDDLPTLHTIDLVDMKTADEELKASILRHGKRL